MKHWLIRGRLLSGLATCMLLLACSPAATTGSTSGGTAGNDTITFGAAISISGSTANEGGYQ